MYNYCSIVRLNKITTSKNDGRIIQKEMYSIHIVDFTNCIQSLMLLNATYQLSRKEYSQINNLLNYEQIRNVYQTTSYETTHILIE